MFSETTGESEILKENWGNNTPSNVLLNSGAVMCATIYGACAAAAFIISALTDKGQTTKLVIFTFGVIMALISSLCILMGLNQEVLQKYDRRVLELFDKADRIAYSHPFAVWSFIAASTAVSAACLGSGVYLLADKIRMYDRIGVALIACGLFSAVPLLSKTRD